MTQLQNLPEEWQKEIEVFPKEQQEEWKRQRNQFLQDVKTGGAHQWDALMLASTYDLKVLLTALRTSLQMTLADVSELKICPQPEKDWSWDKKVLWKIAQLTRFAKYHHGSLPTRGWLLWVNEKFPAELKIGLSKTTLGLIGELLEEDSTETND